MTPPEQVTALDAAPRSCARSSTVPAVTPKTKRARFIAKSFRVEVLSSVDELVAAEQQWCSLVEHALERNVFFEPFMLIPAYTHLRGQDDVQVVVVYGKEQSGANPTETICGIFPLIRKKRFNGIPARHVELWSYPLCPLHTPLVHRDCAEAVISCFLESTDSAAENLCVFRRIASDGLFYQALAAVLFRQNRVTWLSALFNRAGMRRSDDAEQYMAEVISRGRLKEYRRLERRLSEQGKIEYLSLSNPQENRKWIESFLEIEASGWKGDLDGALGQNANYRQFFEAMISTACDTEKLTMLALMLDGEPIAMKCNFVSGPVAFAFKIGFREEYNSYSPGVLLELENIRQFHADEELEWMDSCADPEHPMIDGLWSERQTMQTIVVAGAKRFGGLLVTIAPLLRFLNNGFGGSAAKLRYKKGSP